MIELRCLGALKSTWSTLSDGFFEIAPTPESANSPTHKPVSV